MPTGLRVSLIANVAFKSQQTHHPHIALQLLHGSQATIRPLHKAQHLNVSNQSENNCNVKFVLAQKISGLETYCRE